MIDSELLALAKKQLGPPASTNNASIPRAYLDELRKHTTIYPDDTHFLVGSQPGAGFGIVVCLEEGCEKARIPLTKRLGASDGGKKDGIGTLREYRAHIQNHPTHKAGRLQRLKNATGRSPSGGISSSSSPGVPNVADKPKRVGLLSALDRSTPSQSPVTSSSTSSANMRTNQLTPSTSVGSITFDILPIQVAKKFATQVITSLPTKRPSEGGPLGPEDSDKRLDGDILKIRGLFQGGATEKSEATSESAQSLLKAGIVTKASSKRAKVENYPTKIPLSLRDSNRKSPSSSFAVNTPSTIAATSNPTSGGATTARMTIQEAKAQSVTITQNMSRLTTLKASISRKRRISAHDRLALVNIAKRMLEFQKELDECEATIGAAQPTSEHPATAAAGPAGPSRQTGTQYGMDYNAANAHPLQTQADPLLNFKPIIYASPTSPEAPAASSSKVQLPLHSSAPLHSQMVYDPMFQIVDRFSGISDVSMQPPADDGTSYDNSEDEGNYDADGDWFGRGKDRFKGPVAQVGDLQKFFQEAGNAEQFDGNASVAKALERLGLPHQNTPFAGMAVTLMPHQVIGVAWMLDREKGVLKGGILSDEMGLGKTVQMIATMVANHSDDPAWKTTLILAPLALLGQWKLEIEMKTNDGLKVLIYHGSGKPKTKTELMKYDVVLTTFSTLALEWPDPVAEEKKKEQAKKKPKGFITSDSEDNAFKTKRKKKKEVGILISMNWYRIVLDEAQNIRNRKTRISRAVTQLSSKYNWCLTGTPITNGLADIYPLLRFLQIRPWYDWTEFNGHIMRHEKRQPRLATSRLQVILASCLLRRKKDTELDGKRLIELPTKDVLLQKLEFTPDERAIYKMVETRSQQIFNKYLRAGTVLKNYAQVLVMLLRLRQICSHTSLITETDGVIVDDDLENSKEDNRDELIHAQTLLGREFVIKLKTKLRDVALERLAAEKESPDATVEDEECPICYDNFTDAVVTPCMHFFCRECIQNVIVAPQILDAEDPGRFKANERPCPSCRAPVSREKIFSREVFEPTDEELQLQNIPNSETNRESEKEPPRTKASTEDNDEEMPDVSQILTQNPIANVMAKAKAKGKAKAKAERQKGGRRGTRRVLDSDEDEGDDVMDEDDGGEEDLDDDLSDFIIEDDEDEEEKDARRALKKRLGKCRAIISDEDSDVEEVIVRRKQPSASVGNGPIRVLSKLLPSTKMMFMMENLQKVAEEHPDEKTLIISQWTQCLELVSAYLLTKDIDHVRYQGDMNREKRDAAVRAFMTKKAPIMLMSLKCGGVGLNLTRANRVISLDLGWSEAVESQAFDRVHRLGQTRPVVVQRLVISDTVEDRVLAMQEKKKNLADGSLGEGNGQKIGRLSVSELANLFGLDYRGRLLE